MTITEIFQTVLQPVGLVGLAIVIGSVIKIKPLELNFWQWVARKLGNALNYDTMHGIEEIQKRQDEIEHRLIAHIQENEQDIASRNRKHILIFANDILEGKKHTKEQFINVLQEIDDYQEYCKAHPDFPNNRCLLAIDLVTNNYRERLEKSDFLAEDYRTKVYDKFENDKNNKK